MLGLLWFLLCNQWDVGRFAHHFSTVPVATLSGGGVPVSETPLVDSDGLFRPVILGCPVFDFLRHSISMRSQP